MRLVGFLRFVLLALRTPQEKKLGKLVKEKFKTDFYIVDQ
jgi:hypothetical protein